jgi:protein SCO1/2
MLAVVCAVVVGACGERPAGPDATRHDLAGVVVRIEGDRIVLAHEAIEGVMEAMVMPFQTRDEWALTVVTPGDRVTAVLVLDGDRAWIENLVVTQAADGHDAAPVTPEAIAEGTEVPDFALVNQSGAPVSMHALRGRAVLLTFIYTRCPIPDFCPLMTRHFAQIDRALRAEPVLQVHLMSVSFDSVYDSPEAMRRYAQDYRPDGNFDGWDFVAGTEGQAREVAEFFGLEFWEDTGQWIHNLRTVLIDPQGRVAHVYLGNDWTPDQVLEDLRALTPIVAGP